jgi:hypothetical protein
MTFSKWLLLLLLLLLCAVRIIWGLRNNLSILVQPFGWQEMKTASTYEFYDYDYSPVCRPSFLPKNNNNNSNNPPRTIRRLYFLHMRKAGGTTLQFYFRRVAKKYKLKYTVKEATTFEIPQKRSDTLYITHLRHPISRAISHYKYSERWSCRQLTSGANTKNQSSSVFVATKENSVHLKTWMDCDCNENSNNGSMNGTCDKHINIGKAGWNCASNCYIRWLNFPDGFCASQKQLLLQSKNSNFYRAARDKLYKFDVVLDVDKLFKVASYAEGVERLFGVQGLQGSHKMMYCGKQSQIANAKFPLVVENETLAELYRRNRPDHALYKEVTSCGKEGIVFPNHVLSDFLV